MLVQASTINAALHVPLPLSLSLAVRIKRVFASKPVFAPHLFWPFLLSCRPRVRRSMGDLDELVESQDSPLGGNVQRLGLRVCASAVVVAVGTVFMTGNGDAPAGWCAVAASSPRPCF